VIEVGGVRVGGPGDTEYCGLIYPDNDKITKNMAARLKGERFYQCDKLDFALESVPKKRRRVAVDCGAWVGAWSHELASKFDKVIAIEANAENVRCLKKNLAQCKNATVLHWALGECNTEVLACPEEQGANIGSRIVAGAGGRFTVGMRRLDDLPEIQALPCLDYLKVHVNGMELRTIKGATATIKKHRPLMTVVVKRAIEDYGDSAKDMHAFLRDALGYEMLGGKRVYEIWSPK
jgi:FkbM family methyltransferase